MSIKYCSNCGNQMAYSDIFCSSCGSNQGDNQIIVDKNKTSSTDALKGYFKHLYTIAGCSSRKEYWLGFLWMMIFAVSFHLLWSLSYGSLYDSASGVRLLKCYGFVFAFCKYFVSISLIFSMCRRLHDANISGWFLLLLLVPIFGWIVIFVLLCQRSQEEGQRKYGNKKPSKAINHLIGWFLVIIFGLFAGIHEMKTIQFKYEESVNLHRFDMFIQKENEGKYYNYTYNGSNYDH